jgi:acetate kinase
MMASMSECLAVVNAGSSSIKFALYEAQGGARAFRGQIEGIGVEPRLTICDSRGAEIGRQEWAKDGFDHRAGTREIIRVTGELLAGRRLAGVGHRVVHGGANYSQPLLIDDDALGALEELTPLAPLHQPHNLAPIRAIREHLPGLPQIACFDTAFHRGQARVAQSFALPRSLWDEGVRRYGFHGLSYEFVSREMRLLAPALAKGKIIIAHLGNGASLCALDNGRSVASTMGFTALDGLMMGTRCGAIDPGVILYLMDRHGMDARALEDLIYRRSGLLGVSGISSDMRALRASKAPEAREAIQLFVHRIVREMGSLAAALGGLDGMVFTGGIGENDGATRAEVGLGCAWLGLAIEESRNAAGAGRISTDASSIQAWVVRTDEERMIATHAIDVLDLKSA